MQHHAGKASQLPRQHLYARITNLGIMFLQDAVVATWTDLGYLGPVLQAAQREMHPICSHPESGRLPDGQAPGLDAAQGSADCREVHDARRSKGCWDPHDGGGQLGVVAGKEYARTNMVVSRSTVESYSCTSACSPLRKSIPTYIVFQIPNPYAHLPKTLMATIPANNAPSPITFLTAHLPVSPGRKFPQKGSQLLGVLAST